MTNNIPTINELSCLAFDPIIADILYQSYFDIGHISEAKEISSLYKSVFAILRDSRDYTDILQLERKYSIKRTTIHWSIVINNCFRLGDFVQAFEVYNQSRKAGITPDTALIAPLLRALAPESIQHERPLRRICRQSTCYLSRFCGCSSSFEALLSIIETKLKRLF